MTRTPVDPLARWHAREYARATRRKLYRDCALGLLLVFALVGVCAVGRLILHTGSPPICAVPR